MTEVRTVILIEEGKKIRQKQIRCDKCNEFVNDAVKAHHWKYCLGSWG